MERQKSFQNNCLSDTPDSSLSSRRMADILGETLVCQSPPLTVGVFGKWSSGKSHMLKCIRERMETLTSSKKNADLKLNIFSLIFRLFFFYPNLNSTRNSDVRILFVDFSILDYAGSDRLWAGIITHISTTIDIIFGKWGVKIFRAWHYKPCKDLKPYLEPWNDKYVEKSNERWIFPPFKVFVLPLLVISLICIGIGCWIAFGVPSVNTLETTSTADITTVAVTAIVGLGVGVKIADILKMVFQLARTQSQKISAMSKKADFGASLGFMGKVKTEVYYMTSLIRYAGVLLNKNFRICLIIDDVDLLGKDKIMKLFQVVSLLQSSPCSLYIQILCMDPMVAANLIKKALSKELSSNINGHAYLRKHIQLPFNIPNTLDHLDQRIVQDDVKDIDETSRSRLQEAVFNVHHIVTATATDGLLSTSRESPIEMEEMSQKTSRNSQRNTAAACSKAVGWVRKCLLCNNKLRQFVDGNERAVTRITISAQLAMHIMLYRNRKQQPSKESVEQLVAWIIFVDQWPYRVSWIRQILEDNSQLHNIDPQMTHKLSEHAYLEDVYQLVIAKLSKPEDWQNLLDLDGDPELFFHFLQFVPFTVKDMRSFLPYTTNLDTSIRRIIAQSSAKDNIRSRSLNVESSQLRWWHNVALECWTVDDVCNELEKIGLNERNLDKYKEVVHTNNISGKILCETSVVDLRTHFGITPGDWNLVKNTFSALKTFYGLSPTRPGREVRP